jgi:hypothetical protein
VRGKNFICVAEGFPPVPFLVDTDLTRADGIIQCREVTQADVLKLGWKLMRLTKYLGRVPLP